jgi:hypothetical protein
VAILEKEILVELAAKNIKYYENLGYEIKRIKKSNGKYTIPHGTKLMVKTKHLPNGDVRVTKICDDCGKRSPNQTISSILSSRKKGDGKDRCYICGMKVAGVNRRNNVKYEKTLEFFAIKNDRQYLLNEFSSINIKKPNEISYGTADKYLWICPKCNNEYDTSVAARTNTESGCPYCTGVRVLKGYNDLWTTHPEVATLLYDSNRGFEVTYGSVKKEIFQCKECGNIEPKILNNIINQGFSCSKCSDGISYPEKFIYSILEQINITFERQKVFEWAIDKKYDFYLPPLNMIIETHGRQHYEESFNYRGSRTLMEEQQNDRLKEDLAKSNNINEYITLNGDYVKTWNSLLEVESELGILKS